MLVMTPICSPGCSTIGRAVESLAFDRDRGNYVISSLAEHDRSIVKLFYGPNERSMLFFGDEQ